MELSVVRIVIICIAVSCGVQLFSSKLSHFVRFWRNECDRFDILYLTCIPRHNRHTELAVLNPPYASFFEDPLVTDSWKTDKEDETGDVAVFVGLSDPKELTPEREAEALAALNVAQSCRKRGNIQKAKVLVEHALALAPSNPDILTELGLLHEHNNDVIAADMCYAQALIVNPSHEVALLRRSKTLPGVSLVDKKMLNELHVKKEKFIRLPHSSYMRRAMRESYFMHIYHTVAIEGNTLSLGETRAILETGRAIGGKSLREQNEVIGMDSALRYLNRTLISSSEITVQDILEMHRRVLGHSDPENAGYFRNSQVYVGRFTPVAPEYVPEQMTEFVEWLNRRSTAEMDVVERAAIAHYKLVLIHPFVDGNGRTARLLLNLILMRSGYPPVILPVESRAEYYAVLNTANLGDLRPFVRYVATHTDSTLEHFISLSTTNPTSNFNGEEQLVDF